MQTQLKKPIGPIMEEVTISPQVAQAWLDKNTHNRKLSSLVVNSYARDIAADNWLLTGDAIRFSKDGTLLDGQHRLAACVLAEKPFRSFVLYNVDTAAQDVIDCGKPRRARDVLHMHGFHNASLLETSARWLASYKLYQERADLSRDRLTNQEILEIVAANKRLPASVNVALKAFGPYPGLLAFVHYAASEYLDKRAVADAFVAVFKTGEPSRVDCPAHKLREFFVKQTIEARGVVMRRHYHYRIVLHTWNLFDQGLPWCR